MDSDDLTRLDHALVRSARAFHACFDNVLAADPVHACGVKGSSRAVYLSTSETVYLSEGAAGLAELGTLLQVAGVGPLMAFRRREHAMVPPAHPALHVPDDPWVRNNEEPSSHSPVAQVQACLKVLAVMDTAIQAWARKLARSRLADLLLDFPILLHPRFVWAVPARFYVALPMLHAISVVPSASPPAPMLGIPAQRLRSLALHPVMPYAVKARAPRLQTGDVGFFVQGRTFFQQVTGRSRAHFFLTQGLLHADRLRTQNKDGDSLFTGTAEGTAAISSLCERAFLGCWTRPSLPDAGRDFLSEFREWLQSSGLPVAPLLLNRVGSIFIKTNSSRTASPDVAPDPVERYDRLVSLLVTSGVFESLAGAARAIVERLFTNRDEGGVVGSAPSYASAQVACALIERWEQQGLGFDELAASVGGSGDAWDQVVTAIRAERQLELAHRDR